jgi:diguanylate cyclase (GGDEF)-like protein
MDILLTITDGRPRADVVDRLRAIGGEVQLAGSGPEVLRRLEESGTDAILLDRTIGDTDGLQLCRSIKSQERWSRTPLFLLLRRDELVDLEAILGSGADEFLVEPVDGDELALRLLHRLRPEGLERVLSAPTLSGTRLQKLLQRFMDRHRDREEELLNLFLTDPLTGLFNRSFFKIKLAEEFKRAVRYGTPLSTIMLRIGAAEGRRGPDATGRDKEIAGILLVESRDLDVLARYGPSAFSLLLPSTPQEGAVDLAQRVSERIHERLSKHYATELCTVRAGIATFPHPEVTRPLDLVERAGGALDRAVGLAGTSICIWEAEK